MYVLSNFTQFHFQHDIYQLLYIQSSTSWRWAVKLLETCKVNYWNKLKVNSASCWFLLRTQKQCTKFKRCMELSPHNSQPAYFHLRTYCAIGGLGHFFSLIQFWFVSAQYNYYHSARSNPTSLTFYPETAAPTKNCQIPLRTAGCKV